MRRFDADTTGAFRLLAVWIFQTAASTKKVIIFMSFTKCHDFVVP